MLTGLVQSLGTSWGLARHYWVLAKLLINIVTTVVLLLYLPTFAAMAAVAAEPGADLAAVRNPSPVIHAGAAMVLLLLAAALSVYKPRHYPLRLATPTAGTRWQPPHHRKGAVTRVEIALADHPPPGPLTRRKGSASLADSAAAISTSSAASTLSQGGGAHAGDPERTGPGAGQAAGEQVDRDEPPWVEPGVGNGDQPGRGAVRTTTRPHRLVDDDGLQGRQTRTAHGQRQPETRRTKA